MLRNMKLEKTDILNFNKITLRTIFEKLSTFQTIAFDARPENTKFKDIFSYGNEYILGQSQNAFEKVSK